MAAPSAPRRPMVRLSDRPRRRIAGEPNAIVFLLGVLLVFLAIAMGVPMLVDLAAGNPDWRVFLESAMLTLFVGIALMLANRRPGPLELDVRDAFLLTSLAWTVAAAFASLPLVRSELGLDAADAFFEAMSGLTTTGSTVIVGLDAAPPGILLWRALLQWVGGIGIIVVGIAVLPMLRVGGMQLFRSESSDRSEKVLPRAREIAGSIGRVYLGLSLACATTYWLLGMTLFDAAAHAMTSIATGGYSTKDASFAHFADARLEWAATLFMLSGALPFVVYVQALRGQPRRLWRDAQVRWFLGLLGAGWLTLGGWLFVAHNIAPHDALRLAAFNVTSIVTTTGYATADYGRWGTFALLAFFFLTFVGGCTGSTAGGIKIFRFAVLYAAMQAQIRHLLQPHRVANPTFEHRSLSESVILSVMAFLFLFALTFSALAVLLGLCGLDYLTAMSGAITALANVGPGLGPVIGPVGSFQPLPDSAKWLLSLAMLLGRLELFTVLVLFAPAFWRD